VGNSAALAAWQPNGTKATSAAECHLRPSLIGRSSAPMFVKSLEVVEARASMQASR
jgi:hypothetical protein